MNEETNVEMEMEKTSEGSIHFHEKATRNKKTDFYIEVALFVILGVLLGIALKTEATKRISIGYDDYKMKIVRNTYDLNKAQLDLAKKRAEESANQAQADPAQNGSAQEQQAVGDAGATAGGSCGN